MIGLGFVVAGVLLVVVGLAVAVGPWALVPCGAVLVVAGLLVPWEEVTRAESSEPPSRAE